ncbi:MAG TPA: toll/interleukin-1 receptor domain-containing protein, partial [Candidatus Hydrogenedentes bacterium]|nr:toll/interleukin-1 receptor domain-containing protein [Candidatus Hydrogenedentota bacterium]
MSSRDSVFISYSHKDKQYLDALKTMLAPIQRNHNVSIWEDTQISPGALWRDEINDALNSAKVAVFLVSDNFLASNFIVEHELHPLLQAATNDGVVILWVLIRECMWETIKELEERQAVHPLTTPLERLSEPEQRTIFKELGRKVLENLNATPSLHKDGTLKTTGHLPLHNLPLDSLGDLFKGREDALATLHASLTQNKTTAVVQKQAIHGLGGIGKTRLAVEYAYRYAREYTALLFVRADAPAAVHASLAALADLLHLPERDAREEPVKTAAVLHWLETNTGWLLILDNVDAEAAAAAVLPLLPRLNNGCVLITTRRAHWSPSVNRHELDILAIEDAAAYLLERTDHDRTKSPEDQLRAEELAKNLGGLPLALELAAAYINSRHWSFERYLELWETERKSILEWHDKLQTEYPFSLAFTWQASFDQLTPQARVLLNICAFLAPNPIPEFLFEGQEDHLQEALDGVQGTGKKKKKSSPQIPFNVTEALAGLYTYSLITPEENNAFSIHRLVQEVVRSRLPNDSHPKWIQIALTLVDTATPFETFDVRTWPVMNQLHPHALTITAQADTLGISEPTARLMGGLGNYLLAKALYVEAEPLMRRALKIMDTSFGQEHPDVAAYLNNLAQLLQATNRLEEAEPLMKRALEIDENSFGPDHPDVARDLNNLAGLLWNTNRLAEAEPLMRRALEIWENPLGPEHPIVATCLNNLAQLLQATNRLTDAEPLMRRALEIDENSLGPDHPDVARDLNNLAQLL